MSTDELMVLAWALVQRSGAYRSEAASVLRAAIESALTNAYAEGRKDEAEARGKT